MKNMSFGKMIGIFAGFLILIIVCAVVVMKLNQKNSPGKQVTTKTYKHSEEQQAGAEAPAGAQAAPTASPSSPAAAQGANPPTNQMLGLTPTQQPQGSATNMPVDIGQRLTNIDNSLSSLDARVSALEGSKRTDAAKTPARKRGAQRTAHVAKKTVSEDKEKSLSEMPGYKSMAVVSNRAWVSAPDGNEDSVTKGEPVPRARVRSMNTETGVVITTTDQRIEPNAEQRTEPARHTWPRPELR